MEKLPKGLKVYDPSEIKVKLIRQVDGQEFKLYGFSSEVKISYVQDAILLHLQATSDCVPMLLKELNKAFTFHISSEGMMTEFLSYFDQFKGYLRIHNCQILGNEIPEVIFTIEAY